LKKIILLALIIYAVQQRHEISAWLNPPTSFVASVGSDVVLYSTQSCGYCRKARELMTEKNIPYAEYDIEKSPVYRARWAELGGRGVPVLVVNNNVIHGYRPAQILEYASQ